MRLYLLKLKNKPRYFAAKLTFSVLSGIDAILLPGKNRKRHSHFDFHIHASSAKDWLTYDNPAYARAIQQIEHISAHLEKILSNAHFKSIKKDHYTMHSLFLLHEALTLIYRNLTSFRRLINLRRRPVTTAVKRIAASGRENLNLAKMQAETTNTDMLGNPKFSAMHTAFDKCFEHLGKYSDELAGMN